MKFLMVLMVALFSITACARFDEFVSREAQCMLYDVAKQKAAESNLEVNEYLKVAEDGGIIVCPAATVVEAVAEGYTVVE